MPHQNQTKFFNQTARHYKKSGKIPYDILVASLQDISLKNVCKKKFLDPNATYYLAEDTSGLDTKEIIIKIDNDCITIVYFHKHDQSPAIVNLCATVV